MPHLITRLLHHVDRQTLAFVTKINIYGFGLLVFWTVANITLLPTRVEETAPQSLQGSALGLISFLGVGFAVFVQPLAGRVSDAWPGSDKRRLLRHAHQSVPFSYGKTIRQPTERHVFSP